LKLRFCPRLKKKLCCFCRVDVSANALRASIPAPEQHAMRIKSNGALIDELRQHRLLTQAQLAHLPQLTQGRCQDAQGLAKALGQRGWLTIYQINQILAGHGKDLVFGSYHILDKLGTGGLSNVFKARHVLDGWIVALKVIKPEIMAEPNGRGQFMREIEALSALDHPNIVHFCDADLASVTCCFAMEFVDGTDLGKVVRLSGSQPVSHACDYIRQTALGLQHAYERNLIHRDIKPVNLFLTSEQAERGGSKRSRKTKRIRPLIKILDWGLAAFRRPNRKNAETIEAHAHAMVGTADYLSPDQAKNATTVDIRGDIYSLGCTFYYLLSGQAPFPTGTLMRKLIQHQQAEPEPIESFRKDVPAGVTAILKRMLAKQPEERFQTPAAVALALAPFVQSSPAVSAPHATAHI
jgi:serine/threonine-protein kinase